MDRIFATIGFANQSDLLSSLLPPKTAPVLGAFSAVGGFMSYLLGLQPFLISALCVLLSVELISGITAAKLKGEKLTSRRMQRFGIMILVWGSLLFVMNGLALQYEGQPEEHVAHCMHSTVVFYIIGVYTKSIVENAENIWKNKLNAKEFLTKLFKK